MKTIETEKAAEVEIVNYLRTECGFTPDELAVLFNVTPLTIYMWQSGKTPMNTEHSRAVKGLFEYLSVMRVSLEARKMFAAGYLQGRMFNAG